MMMGDDVRFASPPRSNNRLRRKMRGRRRMGRGKNRNTGKGRPYEKPSAAAVWKMENGKKRKEGREVFLAPKNQGVGKRRKDKASEEQWRRERKNGKKGYEAPSSLISRERGKDGMKKKQKRNQRIAFFVSCAMTPPPHAELKFPILDGSSFLVCFCPSLKF